MNITPNKSKKRLIFTFAMTVFVMLLLMLRLGWIQIVDGAELTEQAVQQQTRDVPIEAARGVIYDRNGNELAISASCYTIWVRPGDILIGTEAENEVRAMEISMAVGEILGKDAADVKDCIYSGSTLTRVAKYIDKETAEKIRQLGYSGVEIAEGVKRYYPMGAFAAHLLGSVNADNIGQSGVEQEYDEYLSGVAGRWIKTADVSGKTLAYGTEKYYQAEDGLGVVLTIDEVIQHYVEKALEEVRANTEADRVMCLVMDPETGEVLAMAITPDYDPNDPRAALNEADAAALEAMSNEEKVAYWNRIWRNPIVSDVYEPGSTSKLLTTSIALEEGLTNMNEGFVCTGYYQVADRTLKCWRYYQPHGSESLKQAVGNSCNPVFIQLAQRIGLTKYYDYLEQFGMTQPTGIDYPAEASPLLQDIQNAGPVGLATMSYGQGIAVSMIQQLTAVCSLGNDGKLMEPHLVKALVDADGNVVQEIEPVVVRQVISEETASQMREIMEYVVSDGGGGAAKVPGYRIGGKTGTANKAAAGGYSAETYSSFIGMAPMDDPQVALLVVVDNPKGVKFGSLTAGPGARAIFEDVLRYMEIEPQYTDEELAQLNGGKVTVPNLKGSSMDNAIGILAGCGLGHIIEPAYSGNQEKVVTDQYPAPGEKLAKEGTVYLYWD